MRQRARTDLCGGRSAMIVPTATVPGSDGVRPDQFPSAFRSIFQVILGVLGPPILCHTKEIRPMRVLCLAAVLTVPPVLAQGPSDPAATIAAQRDALKVLASLDGVWRGPAWTLLPSGEKHTVTQTERIGP